MQFEHNQFEPEWDKIANKPSTFTPSAHTHTGSQITDFPTLGALALSLIHI